MTKEDLSRIAPHASAKNIGLYTPLLNTYTARYAINTKARKAAFLATILHESGSFRYVEEIASGAAYEGRKDLGNTEAGDGVRYKGRASIQITGRDNYTLISKATGVDFVNHPELLTRLDYAVMASCWWWNRKGLNQIADTGDFRKVTRVVNGGYNGWTSRLGFYNKAMEVLK